MAGLRFRVIGWGSEELPDLDFETDTIPSNPGYPFWNIACLTAIPASAISAALEKDNGSST